MYFKLFISTLILSVIMEQTFSADGARILAVYPFPARSHFMMHRTLITELVKNGHKVTMITAFSLDPQKLGKNYTEILIEPTFDYWKHYFEVKGIKSVSEVSNKLADVLELARILIVGNCEHALNQPKVQEIINAKQTEDVYDLLLIEESLPDVFLPLSRIYNIPVMCSVTYCQQNYMSQMFGYISPWSFIPTTHLALTDRMSFWERVQNTFNSLAFDFDIEFRRLPAFDALIKKYYSHLPIDFPSTSAMRKNYSAILINDHAPLAFPSPKMDNMINVGGMHIYPNKPLPQAIQTYLDDAEHGAIYFSLGTQVKSKDLPPEKIQIFLDVFRNLKQRVLWKFENDTLPNLSKNVMLKKWMPQNDILAHPNVRVFISHGGLFGTQEAVHHGVPVLGIPFFFDQHVNVMKGVIGRYMVSVDVSKLTREDLKSALNEVLYNPTYREKMKQMSQIFRDRPMGPRETAMYWIDYVIRHKGARHFRSAGLDLKWYQFYLLDVIALFLAAAILAIGSIILFLRWIWQRRKGGEDKQKIQ